MSDTQNGGSTQECVCKNCTKCKATLARMQALPAMVEKAKRHSFIAVIIWASSLMLAIVSAGIPHVGLAIVTSLSFLIIFYLAFRRSRMFDRELKKLEEEMRVEHCFAVAQVRFLDGSVRNEMHDENAIRPTKHGPRIGFSGPVVSKRAFVFNVSANDLADGSREIRGEAYGVNEEERAITGQCYPDLWIETIAYMLLAGLEGSSYVRIVARREGNPAPDKSTRNSRCTEIYYGIDRIFEVLPDFIEIDARESTEPFVREIASVKTLERDSERKIRRLLELIYRLQADLGFIIYLVGKSEDGGVYNTPAGPVIAMRMITVIELVDEMLDAIGLTREAFGPEFLVEAFKDWRNRALLGYIREDVVARNSLVSKDLEKLSVAITSWKSSVFLELKDVLAKIPEPEKGDERVCPLCYKSFMPASDGYCGHCHAFRFTRKENPPDLKTCTRCGEPVLVGSCCLDVMDCEKRALSNSRACPKCGCSNRTVTSEGDSCAGCGFAVSKFRLVEPAGTDEPREGSIVAGMLVVANGTKDKK